MAKIIINLDDVIYERILEKGRIHPLDRLDVGYAICEGTVIPDNTDAKEMEEN
jgi:hypothetical protein